MHYERYVSTNRVREEIDAEGDMPRGTGSTYSNVSILDSLYSLFKARSQSITGRGKREG
jgi:hypothetical protein